MTVKIFVIVAIAGSCLCHAQDTAAGGVTFRSDAQLVLTGFHVTAKKQDVKGLTAADFELLVDGHPRPITLFEGTQSGLPIEIVLLFDTSGSVTGNGLLDEKLFRDNLLAGLPDVRLSVYSFGGSPKGSLHRVSGPTSGPAILIRAFQSVIKKMPGEASFELGSPARDSPIYESIVKTLEDCSRNVQAGARMLVVVSDGRPGGELDPAGAAHAAELAGIAVYPLVVGHAARIAAFEMESAAPPRSGDDDRTFEVRNVYRKKLFDEAEQQTADFAGLGEATGGRAYDPPVLNASSARGIIHALADQVRSEYVAGFSPEPGSHPAAHEIRIRLVGPGELKLTGGARTAVY